MSDINIGQITEALNDKTDRDMRNVDTGAKADAVIDFQIPTADNNYTWYRKYASGWVEQGGQAITNGSNPHKVTLPVEMADANYNINILGETHIDGYSNAQWQVMIVKTQTSPKTTTSFYGQGSITGYNLPFYWEVKGMALS